MSEQGLDKDISNISSENLNFSNLINILKRRKKIAIIIGSIIFSIGAIKTTYDRVFNPTYSGNFTLLISDPLGSSSSANNSRNQLFEELAINEMDNDLPTLIQYLRSDYILKEVASKFNISSKNLKSRLKIERGAKGKKNNNHFLANGIIRVEYFGKDKETGLKIITALSNHYLNSSLKERQQRLLDGLKFLNKQEPVLREKYTSLQNKIVDFRKKNKLLEPSLEGGEIRSKQQKLEGKSIELYSYQERLENMRSQINEGKIITNGFQKNIGIKTYPGEGTIISDFDQKLLNEFLIVESELAKAKAKFTPNSSIIRSLVSRIEKIQPQLIESQKEIIESSLDVNNNEIKSIEKQLKELENLFSSKPELIKNYNSLVQKLKISSDNLAGLVSARENFLLKIAQSSISWKILEPPSMLPYPVSPSFKRGILISIFSGLLIGILIAVIRDLLDNVFHSSDEIEDELNSTILGNIPYFNLFYELRKNKASLLDIISEQSFSGDNTNKEAKRQRFFFQEALRNLFTSIRYLSSDSPIKTISITSSVPEEGKSLINSLLAITMSELNQKVILIDADLRKPQVHKRFNLDNISGLSNYLIEDNLSMESIIQKVDKYPNLSIIPSGIIPPDPTRLLSSKKFESFVENISSNYNYDYIIFDSTPILGLADAALIGKIIDGTILIVSIDSINKENAKESLKRIKKTGQNFLGILTNSLIEKKSSQGFYGYKYQKYGYGYKYGYSAYEIYDKYSNDESKNKNEEVLEKSNFEEKPFLNRINLFVQKSREKFNNLIKWLDS